MIEEQGEEKYINEMTQRMTRLGEILLLENSPGFNYLLEDIYTVVNDVDSMWHTTLDEKKLSEMRIEKLAGTRLLQSLDLYKSELEGLQHQLSKITDPDEIVRDYDE